MGFQVIGILIGLFIAVNPYVGWYLLIGWLLKDAEPSNTAIKLFRFIGIAMVIIGVLQFISYAYMDSHSF
jgi:uncharacterized membrane protein HdeD (DUF308 family)